MDEVSEAAVKAGWNPDDGPAPHDDHTDPVAPLAEATKLEDLPK